VKRIILVVVTLLASACLIVTILVSDGRRATAGELRSASPPQGAIGQGPTAPAAHLSFQIFTDTYPKLWDAPNVFSGVQPQHMNFAVSSKQQIAATVRDIVAKIGTTGSSSHKLGFIVGPIALEYTDDQIRNLIRSGFEIAQEEQVAVGFHIDDSMFWYRRRDLWEDNRNVEWLDWSGTPNTGRRLNWSMAGRRLAPQMCYNARHIISEVTRVAKDVIGTEIRIGIAELQRAGRADLFAGVIVGWETQLGKDFATNRTLGFCGLWNKGYSQARPPVDIDAEREEIVQEFIELWSSALASAGIDTRRLYSHTAFVSPTEHAAIVANDPARKGSFSEMNNFAPPRVAFGRGHNPGFSTYPAPGIYDELYDELRQRPDRGGWASAEGTNVRIGMNSGEETMEIYLARHFNHGATLVNLFGWGVGDQTNPFRRATESAGSIAAYRKFLAGQPLVEAPVPSDYGLPAKVRRVEQQLLPWLNAGGDAKAAGPLIEEMWRLIRANRPSDAEEVVDRLLELIGGSSPPRRPSEQSP
jgi:hypothetical protein